MVRLFQQLKPCVLFPTFCCLDQTLAKDLHGPVLEKVQRFYFEKAFSHFIIYLGIFVRHLSLEDPSLNNIQDIPKNLSGCLLPAFPCKAYNMSLKVNISVYSELHNNNDSQIYKFLVKIPALADL